MKIRALVDFISCREGYRKGYVYEVTADFVKDWIRHSYVELVPEERSKEQATIKPPKNKRGN